jgi:hypothetical protein
MPYGCAVLITEGSSEGPAEPRGRNPRGTAPVGCGDRVVNGGKECPALAGRPCTGQVAGERYRAIMLRWARWAPCRRPSLARWPVPARRDRRIQPDRVRGQHAPQGLVTARHGIHPPGTASTDSQTPCACASGSLERRSRPWTRSGGSPVSVCFNRVRGRPARPTAIAHRPGRGPDRARHARRPPRSDPETVPATYQDRAGEKACRTSQQVRGGMYGYRRDIQFSRRNYRAV